MISHERIVQILYRILRLEGEEFISALYRQLLNREPDPQGFQHHVCLLARRAPKMSFISAFLQSKEAEQIYRQAPHSPLESNRSTVARIISQYYLTNNLPFVHALYNELLGRNPEQEGIDAHIHTLRRSVPRIRLLNDILFSQECQRLLNSEQAPVFQDQIISQSSSHISKCIGIFVGYAHPLEIEGEGIGRFLVRLVNGLLLHNNEIVIYAVTTVENCGTFERLFSNVLAQFPERFVLLKSNSMDWINRHVPVDVWIVPFVGLENAMFLQKPFILCLHDLVYMHFQDMYNSRHSELPNRLNRFIYPLADKAAAVVSHSNYVRNTDGLVHLGLQTKKTHVIRLASPVEEYASFGISDEVSIRHKYHLYGDYIVFPSVIRLHKNHCRLIEAFMKFRQTPDGYRSNLQLVFTDDRHTSLFSKEISDLLHNCPDSNIPSSIRFIGRIPSVDLPSLYKYAIGTIVPTLFEGSCPFPILESLAVGTPAAVSRIEVTKEVITDLDAFLPFDPTSVEEMASSIHWMWIQKNDLLPRQIIALNSSLSRRWSDVASEYYNLTQHVVRAT